MFTNKNIFLKEDKVNDFINHCHEFGFVFDDGIYSLKKSLSSKSEEPYIQFTVSITLLRVYVELSVPSAYWIELGLDDFEPLWEMYQQGYLEIK